jgi:8-oxo-dGTP diphosphatase
MKICEISIAIFFKDGKILLMEKGYGPYKGWLEYPGGKLEKGESKEDALIREIKEELDYEITSFDYLTTVEKDYPEFHLIMHCFMSEIDEKNIKLLEHLNMQFVDPDDILKLHILPAVDDTVEPIKEYFNKRKY